MGRFLTHLKDELQHEKDALGLVEREQMVERRVAGVVAAQHRFGDEALGDVAGRDEGSAAAPMGP